MHRPFNLLEYLVLRVTRIYPALIAGALLAGLVEILLFNDPSRIPMWTTGIDLDHFTTNLVGLAGFKGQFGSYAPTYTVAYELFYYAIWGCALVLLPQAFGYFAMLATMPVLFLLLPSFQFPIVLSALWLMGAGLATYEGLIIRYFRGWPLWIVWTGCYALFFWGNSEFVKHQVSLWHYPGSLCAIPCGLLFAVLIAAHLSRAGVALAIDGWLGEISYPLFLAHGPVIIAIGSLIKASGISLSFGALVAILLGSSIAVAQAIVILVERPVMAWRRSIQNRSGLLLRPQVGATREG
jgi:peptidoglycan/LPS O-acetylase OafA/YrhL